MKVVILAGGLGTRLSEYTHSIPKPMVKINNKPILHHIMSHYAKYNFKNFYIALGYKGDVIKKYFKKRIKDWNVNLIDTGKFTMTGGRLKRLQKYLSNETFLMTYNSRFSRCLYNKLSFPCFVLYINSSGAAPCKSAITFFDFIFNCKPR